MMCPFIAKAPIVWTAVCVLVLLTGVLVTEAILVAKIAKIVAKNAPPTRKSMRSFKHLETQQRTEHLPASGLPTRTPAPMLAAPRAALVPPVAPASATPVAVSIGPDHVYFINLAHRRDRLAHVLQQIETMGWSQIATRIDAVKHVLGKIGCLRSHIKAMRTFLASPHTTALVLEDDVLFNYPVRSREQIRMFFETHPVCDWDILLFSAWIKQKTNWRPYAWRVARATLCTAYVVTRPAAAHLIEVWSRSEVGTPRLEDVEPCDISWNKVLGASRTFALRPLLASQIQSFSDILQRVVPEKNMDFP